MKAVSRVPMDASMEACSTRDGFPLVVWSATLRCPQLIPVLNTRI